MAHNEQQYSTPRSAVGFALAVVLALATFWSLGLYATLEPLDVQAIAPASARVATACADRVAACPATPAQQ
jgi:hypothetical protein